MERGLDLAISRMVRIPSYSVDPTLKNYHWLDLVKGQFDAYDVGADTALLLDTEGNIAEGPGFNIFTVKGTRLKTPAANVLPGITRQTVFDLCKEMRIDVAASTISPGALADSDEVFVTSTAGGIMPVTQIDTKRIANGQVGALTQKISDRY
ncbi:Amino-transferase class IV [Mesorhizobium albiziae]|uniref:Probable branched-chain-amino-acid aminotransferase n=1 Tax=Neomesorhizobium albiziae TaxID=335020 RepID=A0A1I4FU72_9HYPH|nr:hypothetical protein GCM10007937_42790 [Mesorhizobium albiziae]SFL21093.1 Amino-transferase class IV [Mesorhizobium albiziae]